MGRYALNRIPGFESLPRYEHQWFINTVFVGWVLPSLIGTLGYSAIGVWLLISGETWLGRNSAISYGVLVYAGMNLCQIAGALMLARALPYPAGKPKSATVDKPITKTSGGIYWVAPLYVLVNLFFLPGYYAYPSNPPENWGADLLLLMLFPVVFLIAPLIFNSVVVIRLMKLKNRDGRYRLFNTLVGMLFVMSLGGLIFPVSIVLLLGNLIIGVLILKRLQNDVHLVHSGRPAEATANRDG